MAINNLEQAAMTAASTGVKTPSYQDRASLDWMSYVPKAYAELPEAVKRQREREVTELETGIPEAIRTAAQPMARRGLYGSGLQLEDIGRAALDRQVAIDKAKTLAEIDPIKARMALGDVARQRAVQRGTEERRRFEQQEAYSEQQKARDQLMKQQTGKAITDMITGTGGVSDLLFGEKMSPSVQALIASETDPVKRDQLLQAFSPKPSPVLSTVLGQSTAEKLATQGLIPALAAAVTPKGGLLSGFFGDVREKLGDAFSMGKPKTEVPAVGGAFPETKATSSLPETQAGSRVANVSFDEYGNEIRFDEYGNEIQPLSMQQDAVFRYDDNTLPQLRNVASGEDYIESMYPEPIPNFEGEGIPIEGDIDTVSRILGVQPAASEASMFPEFVPDEALGAMMDADYFQDGTQTTFEEFANEYSPTLGKGVLDTGLGKGVLNTGLALAISSALNPEGFKGVTKNPLSFIGPQIMAQSGAGPLAALKALATQTLPTGKALSSALTGGAVGLPMAAIGAGIASRKKARAQAEAEEIRNMSGSFSYNYIPGSRTMIGDTNVTPEGTEANRNFMELDILTGADKIFQEDPRRELYKGDSLTKLGVDFAKKHNINYENPDPDVRNYSQKLMGKQNLYSKFIPELEVLFASAIKKEIPRDQAEAKISQVVNRYMDNNPSVANLFDINALIRETETEAANDEFPSEYDERLAELREQREAIKLLLPEQWKGTDAGDPISVALSPRKQYQKALEMGYDFVDEAGRPAYEQA